MILSALVKRYEDAADVPLGWEMLGFTHALDIGADGSLKGVISQITIEEKKEKRSELPLPIQPPGRGTGIKPSFLCENGGYLFGLDEKKGAAKYDSIRDLHLSVLADYGGDAAGAIKSFFAPKRPRDITKFLDAETAAKSIFAFMVNGRIVDHACVEARDAWNDYYSSTDEGGEMIRCLVTGKRDVAESLHKSIKIMGGAVSTSFVNMNQESFASYGKTSKDRAAEIGKYAAFAYTTALNALLKDKGHRRFIGGDTLVYWAEKGGEAEESLFLNMYEPPKADEDGILDDAMKRFARGERLEGYDFERKFHILCLSPNAARISVRFYLEDTFGRIVGNIKEHYDRLEIAGDYSKSYRYLPSWIILSETTVTNKASDANPLLSGQLIRAIMGGGDYPLTLYNAMLGRVKAGADINRAKAAAIKATLIKNFGEKEVATVALNELSDNRPYVLGRLFSVLERLQERANGSSSIRSRYFASACSNPSTAFPTLLSLSVHHAEKLDNAVFFEKLKGEIISRLDSESPFPAALSLDDQGRFIVGYYHQTQSFFAKREREDSNEQ